MLVQDISSDIRFVSYSLLMFTFPVSAVGLVIVPKMFVVRRTNKKAHTDQSEAARPQESTRLEGSADDVNPLASNGSLQTTTRCSVEPRPSHGPRIQVVTFD